MSPSPSKKIRSVYHFYGYDPRGVRFYDQLFRKNIEQNSGFGKQFSKSTVKRELTDLFSNIHINSTKSGTTLSTKFSLVRWDKVVSKTLIRDKIQLIIHGYYIFLRLTIFSNIALHVMKLNWKFVSCVIGMFIMPVILSLEIFVASILIFSQYSLPIGLIVFIGVFIATHAVYWVILINRISPRFLIWALCFYSDMGGLSRRIDPSLADYDALLDRVADHMAQEIETSHDLQFAIVGHSAGAILAIDTAGRLVDRLAELAIEKPIRLVTLGGAWVFLASHNGGRAAEHRATIAKLLSTPNLEWADVAARQDLMSVPDTPGKLSKILRREIQVSANFQHVDPHYPSMLNMGYWRIDTVNLMKMHMQYVLAPQSGEGFNYLNLIFNEWSKSIHSLLQPWHIGEDGPG